MNLNKGTLLGIRDLNNSHFLGVLIYLGVSIWGCYYNSISFVNYFFSTFLARPAGPIITRTVTLSFQN